MHSELEKDNKSFKQIKYGAIVSYASVFINIVAGLLYTPWMIKQIGKSDYGLYTLAISIIGFFTFDFGLGESVSRFLSKYNAEKNFNKKKDFLGITFKLYFLIDLLILTVLIIVFLFADSIYSELTIKELEKFKLVFIIAAFYTISSFPFQPLNGILISHERFIFIKFMDFFTRLLTVCTLVIVLLMGFRLYALVIVNALVGITTIIVKLFYLIKSDLLIINIKAWNTKLFKEIASFSIWIAIGGFAQRFIFTVTPSVLGAVSGTNEIALFSVASMIEGFVWTITMALNGMFLPRVTNLLQIDDGSKEIEKLMVKVGRIQLIILGLIFAGFMTLGKEFVYLWIGKEFSVSYIITLLLIFPSLIVLTQEIANTAIIAKNLVKYFCYGKVMTATISILLSLVLSSKFGALGAGISIFIGTMIGSVFFMNYIYVRILKIDLYNFFKGCHLQIIIPIIITIVVGFILQSIIPKSSWIIFSLKTLVLFFAYCFGIWKLSLNSFEKNIFLEITKKIKNKI